jgi:hypothetical protein
MSSELLDPIHSIMDGGVASGIGNEEFSSVIKLLAPARFVSRSP